MFCLVKKFLITILLLSLFSMSAQAAESKPHIKVIYYQPQGKLLISEINYELWQELAQAMFLTTTTKTTSDKQTALKALSTGKADIVVGPIEYYDREGADFVNNYIDIVGGVIVPQFNNVSLWDKLTIVLNVMSDKVLWGVLFCFIIIGLILWGIERKHKNSPFYCTPKKGLWRAFWFQATSFTTSAYGDIIPTSMPGQVLTLLTQYFYLFLLTIFTANITAELTTQRSIQIQINSLAQLHDQKIAYLVSEPLALADINSYYAVPVACHSIEELMAMVAQHKVAAAFANRLELRAYLNKNSGTPVVLTRFEIPHGSYMFLINKNNALATKMAMLLYDLNQQDITGQIISHYVGADNAARSIAK